MSTFREREASQNIVVEEPEREVVPRETARFPFSVRGGERSYSIHEFSVSSDNPNFDPRWAHIVKETDGMRSQRYILEIRPANISRGQYGTYPIWIRCNAPDASQPAAGRCTLIIKPCMRLTGKPTFRTWPGGVLSVSLENCSGAGIDVSVSVSHHGSSWSKGWEFELETGDGPFKFEETFEPPADGKGGKLELKVSAEGFPLAQMTIRPRNIVPTRKQVLTAAVVLIAAAVGITLAKVLPPGPALAAQSISFTSEPSSTLVNTTYGVTATGGGSGNPVTFSSGSPDACSVSGATVTFIKPGDCVIDANQAGNDKYSPAPQAQQKIIVTATPPGSPGIELDPAGTLNCGQADVGTPVQCRVTIKSTGGVALDITRVEITGLNSGDFTASNNCAQPLAPGQRCVLPVHFTPSQSGERSATLVIHQNLPPPDHGTPLELTGTGNGTQQPVALTLSPNKLPGATTTGECPAVPYTETITASGGTGPYSYSVTTGALPAGMSLNSSTGVISGTPTTQNTYTFAITATDSSLVPNTGTQPYSVQVDPCVG
jgi:Putative Ig domain